MKNLLCAIFIFLIGHLLQAQTLYLPDRPVRYESGLKPKCDFQDVNTKTAFEEAMISVRKNHLAKAYTILQQLITEDKANCDIYFFAGFVKHKQKHYEQAISYFKMAEDLAPSPKVPFKTYLAGSYFYNNQFELAKKKYLESYEESPESFYPPFYVAQSAIRLGEFEYAMELLNIASQNTVHKNDPPSVTFLKGEIYTLSENYSDAITAFESIASNYNNNDKFKIYYSYALLQESKAQTDKKMNKKARRIYKNIKNKQLIPEKIETAFIKNSL
jgi:tetratricopeptide (TPR) repeat protein